MTRVDFYVLKASGAMARLQFACRLAEKAYRLENTIHILTSDQHTAEQMDELLWTYRDGSFVPHELTSRDDSQTESPITIGHNPEQGRSCDLLINLTAQIPATCDAFPRVAEIVTSDDNARQQSREHYAQYRELGHTLETHKI
jgi:DNA polymerase-3 subunit chi